MNVCYFNCVDEAEEVITLIVSDLERLLLSNGT